MSLYLPLLTGVPRTADNGKRLNAMLDDCESALGEFELSPKGQKQFLASARAFAEDDLGTMVNGGCLALFLSPSSFHVAVLPKSSEESYYVGQHFFVAPLLPALVTSFHYYLLQLSKNNVHLFEVRQGVAQELTVKGMPRGVQEALEGTERQEKSLQFHATKAGGSPVFHGQGGAKDMKKQETKLFVQQVCKSVYAKLKGHEEPLVLACVTELYGMYRACEPTDKLLQTYIKGSPDKLTAPVLVEKAEPLLRSVQQEQEALLLQEYGDLAGTGRTSVDVDAIVHSAHVGKVDLLFLAEHASQWGTFNEETGDVTFTDRRTTGTEELLGLSALKTLTHGGRVFMLEKSAMPEEATAAAVLRF